MRLQRTRLGLVASCLLLAMIADGASAQIESNACVTRDGTPIRVVVKNDMGWAGMASFEGNEPVIIWNQGVANRISETQRLFIYLHECAHHTLGHVYRNGGAPDEVEADCWAIQLMVDGGMVNGSHVAVLEQERKTVRGDEEHLGGVEHVQSLRDCLKIRTDKKAWAAALDSLTKAASDSFQSAVGRSLIRSSDGSATVSESLLNTPGTYDCEVLGQSAIRCMVFAARKSGSVEKRYRELKKIVGEWLSPHWTSVETLADTAEMTHLFRAEDSETGTSLALLARKSRLYFVVRRGTVS